MKSLKNIIEYIFNHPLGRRHRVRALYRFFKWQISQMLFPGETVFDFIGNTKLVVAKGLTGATGNIYTGLHEFEDMGFVLHFLRKDDLFFDVGANVGTYTILASGHIGAKTLAFEPVPKTFGWLTKNINLNKINELVHARNIGLGAANSRILFTKSLDTVNHAVADHETFSDSDTIMVPIEKTDEITMLSGVPILIKIDVEGFETEVIQGMTETLKSVDLKAIIIELNGSGARYGYNEIAIHESLLSYGFVPYTYEPFARVLRLQTSFGIYNTIYLRDVPFTEQRIKSATPFTIFNESI